MALRNRADENASLRCTRRRSERRGCGRSPSGTTRTARRHTA